MFFRNVLLPVDPAGDAAKVIPYVSVLAAKLEAKVLLLGLGEESGPLEEAARRLRSVGHEAVLQRAIPGGAQQVISVASQQQCDAIVLTVAPAGEDGKAQLSGFATELLRSTHVPVLVVPRCKGGPALPHALLVCLDGSALAETCLPYAEDMAKRLGAEVILARVPRPAPAYTSSINTYPAVLELENAMEDEVQSYLQQAARRLEAAGAAARWRMLHGMPAAEIVNLAGETTHSLVVMTAHGRSGFSRWILGSVTEEVVAAAAAPVLVIPQAVGAQRAGEVVDILGRLPVFASLTEGQRRELARVVRVAEYQPGESVVQEGKQARGCFIIVEGEVELVRGFGPFAETVLSRLGEGDLFGEASLVGDEPSPYTANVLSRLCCVALLREDLNEAMRQHPEIAVDLLPSLVRRLQAAVEASAAR